MKKKKKTHAGKVKLDIRQHRFVPDISTSSKVFIDKKTKSKSRSSLKKKLHNELLG